MSFNPNKAHGPKIFKATWVLAICALSYSVTQSTFPPVGYEGLLVLAGLAIGLGSFASAER
jgi:hypothetical protein